jgi:hypothetical protein
MIVPRKQVTAALFKLLADCYPWVTADPRLQLPEDLPGGQQPALFLVKPQEHLDAEPPSFMMPKYTLTYFALILVYSPSVGIGAGEFSAEDLMADILDAVDDALIGPRFGEPNTLGGLVTNCFISGDIFIDTPVFFEHCAIWVPIKCIVGGGLSCVPRKG